MIRVKTLLCVNGECPVKMVGIEMTDYWWLKKCALWDCPLCGEPMDYKSDDITRDD